MRKKYVGDEIRNQRTYNTIGATAFALFGGYDRTIDKWKLSEKLFTVATKVVSNERTLRYESIRQLREEWEAALSKDSVLE